jgi:hypothetical protein
MAKKETPAQKERRRVAASSPIENKRVEEERMVNSRIASNNRNVAAKKLHKKRMKENPKYAARYNDANPVKKKETRSERKWREHEEHQRSDKGRLENVAHQGPEYVAKYKEQLDKDRVAAADRKYKDQVEKDGQKLRRGDTKTMSTSTAKRASNRKKGEEVLARAKAKKLRGALN